MYKGYLIDLDGTAYLGSKVITETIDFTNKLKEKGIPFKFVTNNSSATEIDVVNKLTSMGYNVDTQNIVTTARATGNYLKREKPDASVYIIGSGGVVNALEDANIKITDDYTKADTVIVGLDQQVTYEKLANACLAVRNGATFISTNPDIALPSERGMLPGNGSIAKVVETSTEVEPITIGKPERHIMQEALDQLELTNTEVAMIGDNYMTDIMSGVNMDIDTIFVNTGLTRREDLGKYDVPPTHICETLHDFMDKI
ncbi:TIGR01457 family HAD-type hydrolase [Mollicutes bacterium LVI A0039]|nr:TIGR01457 family HAD-type hydrolase [Mollicutes bacterium LVI A0039]